MGGLFKTGGIGVGEIVITDVAIIATITTSGNWNEDGDYTGSTVGLVTGNVYYHNKTNQRYYYDGTTLRRFTYNETVD